MVNAVLQESSAIVEKPDAGKELKSDVEKSSSVIRSKNARMKRGTERNWGIGKQIQLPAKQARPA